MIFSKYRIVEFKGFIYPQVKRYGDWSTIIKWFHRDGWDTAKSPDIFIERYPGDGSVKSALECLLAYLDQQVRNKEITVLHTFFTRKQIEKLLKNEMD